MKTAEGLIWSSYQSRPLDFHVPWGLILEGGSKMMRYFVVKIWSFYFQSVTTHKAPNEAFSHHLFWRLLLNFLEDLKEVYGLQFKTANAEISPKTLENKHIWSKSYIIDIHVYIFSQWFSHIRTKLPNACDTRLLSSNSMSRTSSKSEYVSRFARSRFSNPNQNTQPSSISCSTCANFSGTRLSIALETGTEFCCPKKSFKKICPAACIIEPSIIPTVAWGVDWV